MAQVYPGGGYPGGGYPGGGYPGGGYPGQSPYPGGRNPTGSGIPIPGRTGKSKTPAPNQNGPLPNFRGNLKVFDEKAISVELGDKRVMDFKRDRQDQVLQVRRRSQDAQIQRWATRYRWKRRKTPPATA